MEKENERYVRVISRIKEKAREILPKGSSVTLFGSRARGDAREDSDWDIHILIPGPEKLDWNIVYDKYLYPFDVLGWDLNEAINPILHSYSGWEKRKCLLLYYNIRDEGKVIYDSAIG